MVVYSDRKEADGYKDRFIFKGKVLLNMRKHLSISDILHFAPGFSDIMKSFPFYLADEGVEDFIQNMDTYVADPARLHEKYPDFFGEKDKSARATIGAIRKRFRPLIDEDKGLHSSKSTMVEDVFDFLKQGKTVIIDLSLKDSMDASIISTMLVRKLFEKNKREFTNNKSAEMIPTVIFVEEAQNVLSEELVKTNANPFVRCAKEGRKFGLGMVAITQRPSAISEEIRTQAENFFAFYMGNSDDIKALVKSNINYDGVISTFIQTETIRGNLYMVTSDRAFAVPVRVLEFEKLIKDNLYK